MVSEKISRIALSATLAIDAKAKAVKAAGIDVMSFSAGEPDWLPPEHIKEAAIADVRDNDFHYSPISGMPALKNAIMEKLDRENAVHVTADNIIITNGGKEALFLIFQALLNPGDEVIVPTPYWVSYAEQIRYAGGVPALLPSDAQFHFRAENVEAAITSRTRVITLNSPSNPTGALIPEEEMKKLAALARKHNLMVISDEVYEHFCYDGRSQRSIASIDDMTNRTLIVNSGSKTYAMTGWRVGFAAGPTEVINAMTNLKSHLSSNTANVAQAAYCAALTGPQDFVHRMREEFDKRRLVVWKGINTINGCRLEKPEGAFYAFIDFDGVMEHKGIANSFDFCERLLTEQHVAIVPGEAFGEAYLTYARFSFASSMSDIHEGLRRLETFCQ